MTALRSGQVAAAAGVNQQTLRYYERRGLLAEPERSLGGHRMYPLEAVTVLRVVKAAQRLGFSLDEIAELLDAGRHRHSRGPKPRVAARAELKLAQVEAKIADLDLIRTTLQQTIAAGCGDPMDCATAPHCPMPFDSLATPDRCGPAG